MTTKDLYSQNVATLHTIARPGINAVRRAELFDNLNSPEASEDDECGGEYTSGGQNQHDDPSAVGGLRCSWSLSNRLCALAASLRVQNSRRKSQGESQN